MWRHEWRELTNQYYHEHRFVNEDLNLEIVEILEQDQIDCIN